MFTILKKLLINMIFLPELQDYELQELYELFGRFLLADNLLPIA